MGKNFDIRGLYHFVLLSNDRSVDEKIREVLFTTGCTTAISHVLNDYISEKSTRPTKTCYYNHNTWKKGPELFNTLKKYIEEK